MTIPQTELEETQRVHRSATLGTIVCSMCMCMLLLILFALPVANGIKKGAGEDLSGTAAGQGDGMSGDADSGGDESSEEPTMPQSQVASDEEGESKEAVAQTNDDAGVNETMEEPPQVATQNNELVVREAVRESFTIADIAENRTEASQEGDENLDQNTRRSASRTRANSRTIDEFGNPTASDSGLAKKGEFEGQSIVVWVSDPSVRTSILSCEPMWRSLRDKGFIVSLLDTDSFDKRELRKHNQAWIFAGTQTDFLPEDIEAFKDYLKNDNGLYICADNAPYLAEANQFAAAFAKSGVIGNYRGDQIMQINWGAGLEKTNYGATFDQPAHPLLTGINFLYEGSSISHIEPVGRLKVILRNSQKNPLVAVDPGRRKLIFDCGFTRYYPQYVNKTAGTVRYGENVAAWLAGKRSLSSD